MKMNTLQITLSVVLFYSFINLKAQVEIRPDGSIFQSQVTINDTLNNNGLTYPLTDGSDGQMLTTDGAGNLNWSTVSGTIDYEQFYEYGCDGTPFEASINEFGSTSSTCGILYDSGGENNDYLENENISFDILGQSNALYTRVILQSLAIEENRDTLFIGEQIYVVDVSSPDTLIFNGKVNVKIQFKSDEVNNEAGFVITWDRYKYSGGNSLPLSTIGFFYNAEKTAIGGGVEQNDAWNTIGENAVLLGFGGQANGDRSTAVGYSSKATAFGSSVFGFLNKSTGSLSNAFGYGNEAAGERSSAFGCINTTEAFFSSAFGFGNRAIGNTSSAFGYDNEATGNGSSAFGNGCRANLYRVAAIGSYNQTFIGSATGWIPTEPVFMVGNGESAFSPSTALTVLKNGNVGIGTMTPDELLVVNGKIKLGSDETFEDGGTYTIATNSNFVPNIDNSFDLGDNISRWNDVYASNGMINTSDARQKTSIKRLDYGLKEVLQLKPVRFQWKDRKEEGEKLGLIAQDLLQVLPEVVKTQDWITIDEEGIRKKIIVENLGVYYSDIIPVLIHSIQEQQEQIDSKNERIDQLEDRLAKIEAQLSTLYTQNIQLKNNPTPSRAQLQQNQPNPFSSHTIIPYFIPDEIQKAQLQIQDANGNILKIIEIVYKGNGQIELETADLISGNYSYSLVIDGQIFETKQMILSK